MFISKKHLSRRTVLRGMGATLALPLLDAMIPARTAWAQTAAKASPHLGFIYFPHGAIMNEWTPAAEGGEFEMTNDSEAARTVQEAVDGDQRAGQQGRRRLVGPRHRAGNVAERCDTATDARAVRGRHGRPDRGPAYRTGHAIAVARTDHRGSSPVVAERATANSGAATPGPSLFAHRRRRCRWSTTRTRCSSGCSARERRLKNVARAAKNSPAFSTRRRPTRSLSPQPWLPGQAKVSDYLESVREIERRIQKMESSVSSDLQLPEIPPGVPEAFEERLV